MEARSETSVPLPHGHNSMVAVLSGQVHIDRKPVGEAEITRLSTDGDGVTLRADNDAMILVLTGEPNDEPVVSYGPFVMNSEAEIRESIAAFNAGRFDRMATA